MRLLSYFKRYKFVVSISKRDMKNKTISISRHVVHNEHDAFEKLRKAGCSSYRTCVMRHRKIVTVDMLKSDGGFTISLPFNWEGNGSNTVITVATVIKRK